MRLAVPVLVLAILALLLGCGKPQPPGHGDLSALVIERDPNPDPALIAWAGCIQTVTGCLQSGGEIRACATIQACGERCVGVLGQALDGAVGREAQLDAFERVFIRPGATCRPPAAAPTRTPAR